MADREERILIELMGGLEKEAKHLGSGYNKPPKWAMHPPAQAKPSKPSTDYNKDGKTNVLDIVKKIKDRKDALGGAGAAAAGALGPKPPKPGTARPQPRPGGRRDWWKKLGKAPVQKYMHAKQASYSKADVVMEKAAIAGFVPNLAKRVIKRVADKVAPHVEKYTRPAKDLVRKGVQKVKDKLPKGNMPIRRGGSTIGDTMKKISMHQKEAKIGYVPSYLKESLRKKPWKRKETASVDDIKNAILGKEKIKPSPNKPTPNWWDKPPVIGRRAGTTAQPYSGSMRKKAGIGRLMPKAVSDWWRKNKTEGKPFPGMKRPPRDTFKPAPGTRGKIRDAAWRPGRDAGKLRNLLLTREDMRNNKAIPLKHKGA